MRLCSYRPIFIEFSQFKECIKINFSSAQEQTMMGKTYFKSFVLTVKKPKQTVFWGFAFKTLEIRTITSIIIHECGQKLKKVFNSSLMFSVKFLRIVID